MIENYLPAIVLAAVALLAYRLLFSRRGSRAPSAPAYRGTAHRKTPKTPARSHGAFRAVSCSGPCTAVREIREKRFLEREAPVLPLPGCPESRCNCIYIHHDDRRSGRRDRRGLSRSANPLQRGDNPDERRGGPRGRRSTDLVMA